MKYSKTSPDSPVIHRGHQLLLFDWSVDSAETLSWCCLGLSIVGCSSVRFWCSSVWTWHVSACAALSVSTFTSVAACVTLRAALTWPRQNGHSSLADRILQLHASQITCSHGMSCKSAVWSIHISQSHSLGSV